jgi:hypothetical protein
MKLPARALDGSAYQSSWLSCIALSFGKVWARFTVKARRGSRRVYVYLFMLHEDAIPVIGCLVVPWAHHLVWDSACFAGGIKHYRLYEECSAFQRPLLVARPMGLYHMNFL